MSSAFEQIYIISWHVVTSLKCCKALGWLLCQGLEGQLLMETPLHIHKNLCQFWLQQVCGLCKGISVGVIPHGAAARPSAEPPTAEIFCFFLSKEKHVVSVASLECYLPKKKIPWSLYWGSQVGENTSLIKHKSPNSNQVVVWIVILFYYFLHKRLSEGVDYLLTAKVKQW